MKNLITLLLLTGSIANADVYCTVNRENPEKKGQFDQPVIVYKKVLADKNSESFLVQGNKVLDLKLEDMKSLEDWNSLENADIIGVSKSETSGTLSIVIGHISTKNLQDMTKLDTAAAGGEKLVAATSFRRNLSVLCVKP